MGDAAAKFGKWVLAGLATLTLSSCATYVVAIDAGSPSPGRPLSKGEIAIALDIAALVANSYSLESVHPAYLQAELFDGTVLIASYSDSDPVKDFSFSVFLQQDGQLLSFVLSDEDHCERTDAVESIASSLNRELTERLPALEKEERAHVVRMLSP